MTVCDILFIINFVVLITITAYLCHKKSHKMVIFNIAIFSVLIIIKLVQINYFEIRSALLDILGEKSFFVFRDMLTFLLFLDPSVAINIQLLSELISIIVFIVLTTQAAVLVAIKLRNKVYSSSIVCENEKAIDRDEIATAKYIFLVYGKLLN